MPTDEENQDSETNDNEERPKDEIDNRPWWKRMHREVGKVKDPYGRTTHGVKWTVKGDGFLAEVLGALKNLFKK
jgi:hypothetical protein